MPSPTRFVFAVHLHQPVGNFDSVFEQHLADVYRPLLEKVDERDFLPIVLHLSGPLLEWLEQKAGDYLDLLGRLVSSGKVELLLSGMYEPVLAALPRRDRVEQIQWMREAIATRFGVQAHGLWLTERVWEPELAADLVDAGVRYALVDDRHFLVTGFQPGDLHVPYTTESDGRRLTLFSIDERLRYLIPFRPPAETADYLRDLSAHGKRLAVFADDGEKFGGWPGTKDWVYTQGWLDQFLTTMAALIDGGEVLLTTLSESLEAVPSGGLAYLPTASYREMESWSLPPEPARRLAALERELGAARMAGPDGVLIRGAHWRNFMVKYPEANRMHKKMVALSTLCRAAGDPADARRAIGRAQCNDAYWHGVFGGLYTPHLRDAIWAELAGAEAILREGEPPAWEWLDIDADGHDELWIHDATFSAIISPQRGAVIEEFTVFAHAINYANVLTRRREGYHEIAPATARVSHHDERGVPSVHDLEEQMLRNELPPIDPETRALIRERALPSDVDAAMYARGDYDPAWTTANTTLECAVTPGAGDGAGVTVTCRATDGGIVIFEKSYRFHTGGRLIAEYRWRPGALGAGAVFAPEVSYAGPAELTCSPAAPIWRYQIETVSKSEKELERTVQGQAVTPRWPASVGEARIEFVTKGRG
ncbi:MAG: alpha-amylase/4-alpha-glucanotransferase domain-containing protein [Gemmatimonadales bacterium]